MEVGEHFCLEMVHWDPCQECSDRNLQPAFSALSPLRAFRTDHRQVVMTRRYIHREKHSYILHSIVEEICYTYFEISCILWNISYF